MNGLPETSLFIYQRHARQQGERFTAVGKRSTALLKQALVDSEQGRRITNPFDDEAAARRSAETAYTYGRRFGRWRVQRASDYAPQGASVTATGWEPRPLTVAA
ncbi:hypothetical protein ACFQO7_22740 [Catellatospora aurea]|uniref:Uncharacterized protein n=1 Tax=Catellatospora aurea TaxID=1337874 RepID=A0ABW2H3T6_9ACTN